MRKYLLILLFLIPSCTPVAEQKFSCDDLSPNTGKVLEIRACNGTCMPWNVAYPIMCTQDANTKTGKGITHITSLGSGGSMMDMITNPAEWFASHMTIPATSGLIP